MATAPEWRDVRNRFETLLRDGGHTLEVSDSDPYGASAAARHLFRLLATGAGRMAARSEDGYTTWLSLLREKLRPLNDSYFSVAHLTTSRPPFRTISLSKIDPPATSLASSDDGRVDPNDRHATVDPAALIEAVESSECYMCVYPQGKRFIVASADRATYDAYVARKRRRARCVVVDATAPGPSSIARAPRTTESEHDEIHRVCAASIELCELLEHEAFAQGPPSREDPPDTSRTARREARKRATQQRHERWRAAWREKQTSLPNMSKTWYATQIAKTDAAAGCSPATIRKYLTS